MNQVLRENGVEEILTPELKKNAYKCDECSNGDFEVWHLEE